MPSANLFLDKRTTNKDGLHSIKITVNYGGVQRRFGIDEYCSEEEFKKLPTSSKHSDKAWWREMNNKCIKAETIIENLGMAFTWEKFKFLFYSEMEIVTKGSKILLPKQYEQRISEIDSFKTVQYYESSWKSLKKFAGENLSLQDITIDFLNRYKKWALNRSISISTVSTYLRPLKTIYNAAIRNGLISAENNPFGKGGFSIGCAVSAKSALSQEQIKAFWKYQPQSDAQRRAKNYWFFSHFCNGIAPVDVAHLEWSNIKGDLIIFVR